MGGRRSDRLLSTNSALNIALAIVAKGVEIDNIVADDAACSYRCDDELDWVWTVTAAHCRFYLR